MHLKGETPPVFLAGREYHDEVDNYHKGKDYNKSLIKPYTDVFKKDYRKQSEVWISGYDGVYLTFKKPVFPEFKVKNYSKDSNIAPSPPEMKVTLVKTPLPVKGKIDGICDGFLADLKYMSGRMSQRQANESGQATFYLWWYYSRFKKIVPFVYNCVDKKTNRVAVIKTTRTFEDFYKLFLKINNFLKEVEEAVKTDNFTGGYGCYPGCCEFINICSNCQRSKRV